MQQRFGVMTALTVLGMVMINVTKTGCWSTAPRSVESVAQVCIYRALEKKVKQN